MIRHLIAACFALAASAAFAQTSSVGAFGGMVPSAGTAVGGKDPAGKLQPLKVDGAGALITSGGGGGGSNASVGSNGVAIPTSSTQVGWKDAGGLLQPVSAANPLPVAGTFSATALIGALAPTASTTATLGANATYTSAWIDTLNYASVAYSIQSDQISAVGGITRQWSQDGVNAMYWASASLDAARTGANNGTDMIVRNHARYYRIVYTNGATPQTFFRLQTILYTTISQGDTIGVDHAPVSGDDALLTKSVMTGKTTAGGGSYVDVKVNPGGTLQVGGGQTPSSSYPNPTDAFNVVALGMGWNGSTWEQFRIEGTNFDSEAVTTSGVLSTESYSKMFNGTTWDRVRGDTTGGLWVQLKQPIPAGTNVIGHVIADTGSTTAVTGTVAVTQSGTWNVGQSANFNVVGTAQTNVSAAGVANAVVALPATANTAAPTYTDGKAVALSTDLAGSLRVTGTVTATVASTTANQGTPAAVANAWPMKIVDSAGTNVATVSAAGAQKVDGSAVTQPISAAALPLPTGAATETTLGTRLADATFTGRINTLGQKTMANSTPIAIASDQSAISTFNGTIDAGNSSTTPLGANGVFTGTAFDTFNFASFVVQVFSNVASAVTGVSQQFSNDGTNWDEVATLSLVAGGNALNIAGTVRARYFRIVYTNGGSAQATFRLQTLYKTAAVAGSVLEIADAISTQSHAQLVRNITAAKNAAGTAVGDVAQSTTTPVGTEVGLIVRPIPSGTQATKISKTAAAPLSTAVSVTTSATLLPTSVLTNRVSLCVYNNGAATMYLGTSGVTTVNGLPIVAGGSFCDDVGSQPYYGIVAAGTIDARVLEN